VKGRDKMIIRLVLISILSYSNLYSQELYAKTIRFGVTPWQKGQVADDINKLYRPLLNYLEEKTGDTYLIISASTYSQMIDYISTGKVDFATLSPVPYIVAKKNNPKIKIVATYLQWNKGRTKKVDSYLGHIVVKKSRSDLSSIDSLVQSRFGFVKKESSSGFKYPNSLLMEKGVHYIDYFSQVYFLGSHPRVTDAIVAGSIDAGATWDFNLSQARSKHGDKFKVIFTTPPIPNLCIAAHPKLGVEKIQLIREHLLSIPESFLKGLPNTGFVFKPDSFYDVVRKLK
jgi:phosphonate transport system substrate-binding protein